MSAGVFNVVSEYPEVQHVAANMRDIGMEEHGCEESKVDSHGWDEAVSVHYELHAQRCEKLPHKDKYISGYETPRDYWQNTPRILIAER